MLRSLINLFAVFCATSSLSARIIDDFSVGPVTIQQTDSTFVNSDQQGLDPTHVLGGVRYVQTGYGGGSATQTATVDTASRKFTFTASGTTLGYVQLRYGSLTQPLNIDLTTDGSQYLLLSFTDITPSTFPHPFNVQIYGAGTSSIFQVRPASSSASDIIDVLIPLSSFSPALSDVDSISISATRYPRDSQFSLLKIATIMPEPATSNIIGISGIVILMRRRR